MKSNDSNSNSLSEQQKEILSKLNPTMTTDELRYLLDQLDLSAEEKGILWELNSYTRKIGRKVIKVGQRVLEIIITVARRFPYACAGAIIGLALWMLINCIPLIGHILGNVIGPLSILIFAGLGVLNDMKAPVLVVLKHETNGGIA